ncbi:MAG: restriction endonuclease subunit S [Burkholderiales bacterium]|nr:restriction endonuclease subunit S [Burkholderiales bacterium]
MQRHESYKPSGVKWLGDVPSHWDIRPGFTCFDENKDRNKKLIEKTVLSLSYGRIVVKSEDRMTGLVPESFDTYQLIKPGDIVIRTTDLQNDKTSLRVGLAKDKGMITSAYLGLRCKPDLNPEYVFRLLESYDALKVFYGMGSGLRQNIGFWDFKRLPVPVPTCEEQNRIVKFLNHKTTEIDAAISQKEHLVELLEKQQFNLVNRAVTLGIDADAPLKPSEANWLEPYPAHWKLMRIKYVLRAIVDTEHKTPPMYEAGPVLVVRTSNVKSGQLTFTNAKFTDDKTFVRWTRRATPVAGDILFTREAPAGEACVLPDDLKAVIGQRMVLFKVDPARLDPHFAVHSIYSGAAKTFIELLSVGSTVAHFNMSDIGNIPLLLPPLAEQQAIRRRIQEIQNEFKPVIESAKAGLLQLRELKKTLIASVTFGQIAI